MTFAGKNQLFLFTFGTCYWLIITCTVTMYLCCEVDKLKKQKQNKNKTMTTPISSHVKEEKSICTARGEDMIF